MVSFDKWNDDFDNSPASDVYSRPEHSILVVSEFETSGLKLEFAVSRGRGPKELIALKGKPGLSC